MNATSNYVPDKLYYRLFAPWFLPEGERHLGKEDWARVDAICDLPWKGELLDFGSGDGTLGALVCSRNPDVTHIDQVESDPWQLSEAARLWKEWPRTGHLTIPDNRLYDGALCCEVLEHLTPEDGHRALLSIRSSLKPGGMLCVTVPVDLGSRSAYPGHVRTFNANSIVAVIEYAGLSVSPLRRDTDRYDYRLSYLRDEGMAPLLEIWKTWLMAVAHA